MHVALSNTRVHIHGVVAINSEKKIKCFFLELLYHLGSFNLEILNIKITFSKEELIIDKSQK